MTLASSELDAITPTGRVVGEHVIGTRRATVVHYDGDTRDVLAARVDIRDTSHAVAAMTSMFGDIVADVLADTDGQR